MAKEEAQLQFSATTRTADLWKSISSAIMTIVDEAHFEATSEGLQFRSMDPSHIALVDISCPAVAFEKYECPSKVKFGFRVDEFSKIIKRAGASDSVELGLQDSMMNIKTSGGYTRSYKLRLIESSSGSSTPLPKLQFDSKLVMAPSILDRILSDIEVVSDKITIETTESKQVVCSTRGDSGEVTITLDDKSNIENLDEISVTKPCKAT
ncbi:MAG TPA: DNA polymerase sliding clamp, partial [Nitrososphaera sp.]|nr:DNA polymerase sliding clamp [Nitrososphaera sp.]